MAFGQMASRTFAVNSPANATVEERMAFLKKVYGLLSLSLLSAVIGAYFGKALPPGLMMPLFIVEIVLVIFAMAVRRKPVWNVVALFSFTTLSGVTLGPVMVIYNAGVIQEALVLTLLIFGGLTFYVMTTKKDFSYLSGFLIVGLITVIIGGLLNAFLFQSPMLEFAMAGGGVILFSGFILYDTSNILRNYDVQDYTSATLALYLDVLNLFLFLLRLLGGRD
ncbi:MAG: Bax inhibitor-1/YccA family protein [SAR324 cluster bacterium]|nr:Bax inhibitor-1/YccA family protein [SAR324 cluster bacterium]